MSLVIEDGVGKGYKARVSSSNRILISGVTDTESIFAAENGDAYNINTGYIASINGDATLLYIKNNEDKNLVVDSIIFAENTGITHSNDPYITLVRNPTGGDLISDATAVAINANRNFASSNTLTADVYKGKVGGTLTGGDDIAIVQTSGAGSRTSFPINLDIPKGQSLGIKLTANVSSGSASVYIAAVCYLKTPSEQI